MFCSFSAEANSRLATRNCPGLISDVGDDAGNRRAVDMDIENVEEDTDAGLPVAFLHHASSRGHRRAKRPRGRRGSSRSGSRKNHAQNAPSRNSGNSGPGSHKPGHECPAGGESQRIINPVANHPDFLFYLATRVQIGAPGKAADDKIVGATWDGGVRLDDRIMGAPRNIPDTSPLQKLMFPPLATAPTEILGRRRYRHAWSRFRPIRFGWRRRQGYVEERHPARRLRCQQ